MCLACAYPVRVQSVQSVNERHNALFQSVQGVLLRVVVQKLVPQTPQSILHQLDLLCLPGGDKNTTDFFF